LKSYVLIHFKKSSRFKLRPETKSLSAQAPGAGAGANAVCLEIWNLRCLSSDRRHAGTESAVGPTEMYALSRLDLGSERGTRRAAQSLSSVCDTRRGQRDP
jgi:hypothetical protein